MINNWYVHTRQKLLINDQNKSAISVRNAAETDYIIVTTPLRPMTVKI